MVKRFFVFILLFLTGCNNAPETPTPTTLVSTATVSPTSAPVITSTSTIPTPILTDTPADTLEPSQNAVNIEHFRLVGEIDRPTDKLMLEWQVTGADEVVIKRIANTHRGGLEAEWMMPAMGNLEQSYPAELGGRTVFYTLSVGDDDTISADLALELPCEYEWLVDAPSLQGCPAASTISTGAQQNFENGFMVWIADQDAIVYSDWSGLNHGEIRDAYEHGIDPIEDPTIVAPEGLYEPEYGFGKVWREEPGVRELLGWGIDWATDYNVIRQSTLPEPDFIEYITLLDGGLVTINHPSPHWQIEYAVPEVVDRPIPTNTPPPPSGNIPVVNYFRLNNTIMQPSQPVVLEWDVTNVPDINIQRTGGEWGEANAQWENLPPKGTLEVTHPIATGGWSIAYTLTSDEAQFIEETFTITLPCEYVWVFDFPYPGATCPESAIVSTGAQQNFEGGLMVWIATLDKIVYTTWDGLINGEVVDTFDGTSDPVSDPNIIPPAGYLQPEYGFGKVWRENASVRQALGWAIDNPTDYEVMRQSEPTSRYGGVNEYIGLHNGGVIQMVHPDPIWRIEYPIPTVPDAPYPPPEMIGDSAEIPTINYFRLATDPARPSDPVMLEWNVVGVDAINIDRFGGEWGEANQNWEALPPTGSIEVTHPTTVGGWYVQYTLTSEATSELSATYGLTMPCEYDWVFEFEYPGGTCPTQAVVSFGAQQNFEHGFMIWIEDLDTIIYSSWSGTTNGEVPDTYQHGIDPISDPNLVPPDGLLQPEYGFGKVWREMPGVRDLLGWATEWGTDYFVHRQSEPPHRYGYTEFILMRDNGLITINHPDPFWQIEYPR